MVIQSLAVRLAIVVFLVACVANEVMAQVSSAPYLRNQKTVSIFFVDDIEQVDLSNVLVFFEDDKGRLVQLWGDAQRAMNNSINITNFRTNKSGTVSDFDLETGGGGVPGIPPGKSRTYTFVVKGLKLNGEAKARPVQTAVDVSSSVGMTPQVLVAAITNKLVPYDRGKIVVQPVGIPTKTLLDKFKNDPGRIRISYRFSADDPAPNVETTAASIRGNPDDASPTNLFIEPQDKRVAECGGARLGDPFRCWIHRGDQSSRVITLNTNRARKDTILL
jgi:hypothetical protein